MFGIDPTILAIVLLVAVSTGAVAYGMLYSRIETDKKTANRINRVRAAETDTSQVKAARDRVQEISKRRKSVQDSLKELEKKQQQEKTKKANATSLKAKLVQSGLPITMLQFYILSAVLGLVVLAVTFLAGMPALVIGGALATLPPRELRAGLAEARACSALTVGSSPYTSSPSSAASIASRMPAVGWVTVSLRRSTKVICFAPESS